MLNEPAPYVRVGDLDRSTYIGGPAAAAVIGLSQWRTPLQLFRQMKGLVFDVDAEKEEMFQAAKDMEPIIIQRAVRKYGIEITARSTPELPNRYQDKEHPFLAAEIDFEFVMNEALQAAFPQFAEVPIGELCNGECKTSHPMVAKNVFGDEGTDEIDTGYAAQCMHGLGVTRRNYCMMVVWVTTQTMLVYLIKRDDEIIAGIREQCVHFWNHHILGNIPPEPVNLDDLKGLINQVNGKPVEATDDIVRAVNNLHSIRSRIKTFQGEEQTLVFEIGDYMRRANGFKEGENFQDNAMLVYAGRPIATYNLQQRAGFIVAPSEFRVLRIKRT